MSNHLQMKITKAALSPQLFKDPECWSGRSLELTYTCTRSCEIFIEKIYYQFKAAFEKK